MFVIDNMTLILGSWNKNIWDQKNEKRERITFPYKVEELLSEQEQEYYPLLYQYCKSLPLFIQFPHSLINSQSGGEAMEPISETFKQKIKTILLSI